MKKQGPSVIQGYFCLGVGQSEALNKHHELDLKLVFYKKKSSCRCNRLWHWIDQISLELMDYWWGERRAHRNILLKIWPMVHKNGKFHLNDLNITWNNYWFAPPFTEALVLFVAWEYMEFFKYMFTRAGEIPKFFENPPPSKPSNGQPGLSQCKENWFESQ